MKSKFYSKLIMVFAAMFMFTYASAQTTVEVQILDPLDDAEEYASDVGGEVPGSVYNTSSDLELVFDSEVQYVGMIFRELAVPAGATIDNAYIQFQVDAVVAGVTDAALTLEIYGNKEPNVTVGFDEAVAFGISSRTPTEAKVAWAPGASVAEGDKGVNEQTDDISTIIAEIVGLDGWASGNALMVIIKWTGDVNQTDNINREMESCDGDPTGAPTLVVTYSEGGGGGGEPVSISVQVADAMDDIEESAEDWSGHPTGTIDGSSSDLEFINEDGLQFVGMIFRNVQIPPNETINSAYIQFYSDKALDGPVTCELYGAAEANITAPFTLDPFSVSVHTSTVASVSWSPGPWGDPGAATEAERSPDISSIIQEIVGIDGWASGNNLMIGSRGTALGKIDNREAVSYDGNPAQAPILHVTYGGPVNTKVHPKHSELSNYIYPNPTEGRFNIYNPSKGRFAYDIYSINGRLVASRQNVAGSTIEVDLSNIAKGMYFVNVRTIEITETHKLILK